MTNQDKPEGLPVEVHDLGVDRGGKAILTGISFRVEPGSITVIAGPNGSGKSTLLQAIAGRLPARGQVRLAGQDLWAMPARTRARLLAVVPQRSQLRAPLSVRTVVAAGRYAHAGAFAPRNVRDTAAIDAALAETALGGMAERTFTSLSCGEQQRVLIARALASEAPVLLLDEPTAGLDPRHALGLLLLLQQLRDAGRTIIVVLHHFDEIKRASERALVLDGGRIAVEGSPDEVLSGDHLRRIYGVEVDPAGGWRLARES
jgi:iron complex transport system ATP-binding protein